MLRLLHDIPDAHDEEGVWGICWSPDGQHLASCGQDKCIRVFAIQGGDWAATPTAAIGGGGVGGSSSSDTKDSGKTSASAASAPRLVATMEEGQSRTIRSVDWSPCGRSIAASSFDGTVAVWEAQDRHRTSWELVASLEGHSNEVKCAVWAPSGNLLATCGRDKAVWIWERLIDQSVGGCEFECVTVLSKHTQDVKRVLWHPSEETLFSCSYDDTIRIWALDGDEWYCAQVLSGIHTSTIWDLCLNPEATCLVSCSGDKTVAVWEYTEEDITTTTNSTINTTTSTNRMKGGGGGKMGGSWRFAAQLSGYNTQAVYSIDWNIHCDVVASGSGDNSIVLYTPDNRDGGGISSSAIGGRSLSYMYRRDGAHSADVNAVRWNPSARNSGVLASAGDDGSIKIWAVEL